MGFGFSRRKKEQAHEQVSREYKIFKEEEQLHDVKGFLGFYARSCRLAGRLIKLRAPKAIAGKLEKGLLVSGLRVSAREAWACAVFYGLVFLGVALAAIVPLMLAGSGNAVLLLLSAPFAMFYYFLSYPNFLAEITKIRASDESIKVILYMAIYMRLNPNVEGALGFAAEHTTGPFGNDLKKILWDLEIGRFSTVEEAFRSRVKRWIEWDKDFLEAFQTLLGITSMVSEEKRKRALSEALSIILERTHEKMKGYGRALRVPTIFIHTLGITLPIMGLVMFPLITIFMSDPAKGQQHLPIVIGVGYTVILPLFLFWYIRRTVAKRPGAYAYPDISHHPELPPEGRIMVRDRKGKKHFIPVLPIALAILLFVSIPGIAYMAGLGITYFDYRKLSEQEFEKLWTDRITIEFSKDFTFTAIFYSLTIIWGAAFSMAFYFYGTSFQRIKIRNQIKQLEDEFIVGLSRLSDVLSTNVPVETAIEEVAKKYRIYGYEKSMMYGFFTSILRLVKELGLTFEQALFEREYGIISQYPSKLVRDVLKVMLASSKKGPQIVALITKSISNFLSKTREVEILIRDILDEVVSNAKMQVGFIAPFITGVVSSTAVLLIQLLKIIADAIQRINEFLGGGDALGGLSDLILGIKLEHIMPPSVFQLIVGTYMVEVTIILGFFLNGLENGFDKTTRNYIIGKYLMIGTILYTIVLVAGILMFQPIMCQIAVIGTTNKC